MNICSYIEYGSAKVNEKMRCHNIKKILMDSCLTIGKRNWSFDCMKSTLFVPHH